VRHVGGGQGVLGQHNDDVAHGSEPNGPERAP
jgi:hypothetical protein